VTPVLDTLRQDLARSFHLNTGEDEARWLRILRLPLHFGTQAVVVHRLGEWAATIRVPGLRHVMLAVYAVAKYLVQILTGICIAHRTKIGPGLVVHTGCGVFVGPRRIGRNCYLQHGVVISYGVHAIGDNVYFGPGAKVHGPVTIGNNVDVAANAVVARDIPDDCTVIGSPARVIPKRIFRDVERRETAAADLLSSTTAGAREP
jgi:serine O-acetyltransferase